MREFGVVVSQFLLKPEPVRLSNPVEQFDEPGRERLADLVCQPVTTEPAEILMNPDEDKRPGPRRCEFRHRGEGLHKQFGRHDLETPMWGTPHAHAQRPKRARVAIFRPSFIEPAAVKAHMIVEPPRFRYANGSH